MTDIKQAFIKVVEATGDGMAAIKMQDAYNSANAIGKMLAGVSDRKTVDNYFAALSAAWPGDSIHQVCDKPEFVVALAGMFCQSLKAWKDKTVQQA